MANNKKKPGESSIKKSEEDSLSENVIKDFLETQKIKAQNESKELALREKEIQNTYKLSEKSLELQAQIHNNRPSESRKFISTIARWILWFFIAFVGFAGLCLYFDKESFLLEILRYLGYVVSAGSGYYFGRKSQGNSANNHGGSQDADVVD